MSSETFKQGLVELYQGEVLGEVLFDQVLSAFTEPDKRYKIEVMLQLETETKARLRPAMVALGLDLREQPETRQLGLDIAAGLKGVSWTDAMVAIRDSVAPAIVRYKAIAASAPAEYQSLAEAMVTHEQSLCDFAERELAGETAISIDVISSQLQYPLPLASR